MRRGMFMLFGMGAGAAMLVLALGNQGNSTKPEIRKVSVLVAARDIDTGAVLSKSDYAWEAWPEEVVPKHALGKKSELVGKLEDMRMRRPALAGEPIVESMLVSKDKDTGFLAAMLEPGQRAISIPVSVKTSAGGFVRPGDFVDILMTYQVRLEGDRDDRQNAMSIVSRYASETVLEKVRVLAVDQVVANEKDAGQVKTVTVAVSRAEAEKVTLAQEMGDLSLSLRALASDEDAEAAEVAEASSFTTDVGIGKALQAATLAMQGRGEETVSTSRGEGPSVRIYNGASVQRIRLAH
jgi:pilus assembly protein CpaB